MKSIKRNLSIILVIVLTLILCLPVIYAENNEIKVMLNGKYLEFDVQPQLVNDRTMVPFRAIFEAMGAEVSWNQDLSQATGEKDGKIVTMTINSTEVIVTKNGEEKVIIVDQAPIVVDGRTLVPARFVAQAFDKIVAWDNEANTVLIFDLQYFMEKLAQKAPNFYEYVTTINNAPQTFKSQDKFDFKMSISTKDNNVTANVEGQIDGIINKSDAYLGLESDYSVTMDSEKISDNIVADVYFKENYLIIKTNIFEILGQDFCDYQGIIYSIKKDGIALDLSQFEMPGINTFEDFMKLYEKSNDIDAISNQINDEIFNQDIKVKDAKDMITMFDLMLDLVSDDMFTKSKNSTTTIYTWEIDKKAIQDFALKLVTSGIIPIDEIDSDLIKEMNDAFKDFKMEAKIYVKNNIPVKSVVNMNIKIADEDNEMIMSVDLTENIANINQGPFKIKHPNVKNALDIMAYLEYLEQEEQQEDIQDFELTQVQDAVTMFILEDASETFIISDCIAKIYTIETNTWNANAITLLELPYIDLTKYQIDSNGLVTIGHSSVMI